MEEEKARVRVEQEKADNERFVSDSLQNHVISQVGAVNAVARRGNGSASGGKHGIA